MADLLGFSPEEKTILGLEVMEIETKIKRRSLGKAQLNKLKKKKEELKKKRSDLMEELEAKK